MTNLSDFQKNIISSVVKAESNVVVNALAGSGKTFTAILAVQAYMQAHPQAKVCMCMFNKSIQQETAEKMDKAFYGNDMVRKQIKVRTSHALGMAALRFAVQKEYGNDMPTIVVENHHVQDLCTNVETYSAIIKQDSQNKGTFLGNAVHLFDKCRVNLIEDNDIKGIERIARHYNINVVADECNAVSKLLETAYDFDMRSNYTDKSGKAYKSVIVCDFIDMLTFAAQHKEYCEKFNLVVVDECQDFNICQHKIMHNSVKYGGKFLAIGDPNQAINGFAGAMNDSFDRFTKYRNVVTLPLSVNYRCGRNIISLAQTIVPNITAHDGACNGNVSYGGNIDNAHSGDIILSRKSAPLVKSALHLLANKKYCYIVGGAELTKGLKGLIISSCGKSKQAMQQPTNIVISKVESYIKSVIDNLIKKGEIKPDEASECKLVCELQDKLECIKAIADNANNQEQVIANLDNLASEGKSGNGIKLMTAHKSKGLEADNVYIIDYGSMPLAWKGQQEWEAQQEQNLIYVAWTRAKQNLYLCN